MEQYLDVVRRSALFYGIAAEELPALLRCLGAREVRFEKGGFVLRAGENAATGLVLEGEADITKEDFWGGRSILARVGPGELFGETYACVPPRPLRVNVEAARDCAVLFLDTGRLMTPCEEGCQRHATLVKNLLGVLAEKNLQLTGKLGHLAQRGTRKKLLSYLSECSQERGTTEFAIPFDRQQLADYLCVDRSALSAELGHLRDEGVLEFKKNRFRLL